MSKAVPADRGFSKALRWGLCGTVVAVLLGCGDSRSDNVETTSDQQTTRTARGAESEDTGAATFRFTDVAEQAGIDMTLTAGRMPSTELIEVKGGGLGLIDFNNNGRLDVFIPNGAYLDAPENGPPGRLYENLGNMQFRDVTDQAGVGLTRWGMAVAVGDYNASGYDDIFVACYGRNVLYRNNGDGTFTDVTEQAGLADDDGWSASAAFADLDGNGLLDLYVANYVEYDVADPPDRVMFRGVEVFAGPRGLPGRHDLLYRNNGDGTFENVSESSGIRDVEPSYGLGVVMLDFTGDGHAEIYVGNDSMPNFLFQRTDDWHYEEIGMRTGIATNADGAAQATMGIAIGDVTGNHLPDVFTTNFSSDTNTLHVNQDGRFFDDRTQAAALGVISRPYLGWACQFFDFNHDGREELVVFNGHIYPEATPETMNTTYRQEPLLFRRTNSRFERVADESAGSWLQNATLDRSAAFGDLDGNGAIDIVVGELNGPVRVLRNEAADGDWLVVELHDTRDGIGNRRGLGARVRVESGDDVQTRWIYNGGSFQSTSAPYAHFGLGAPDEDIAREVTVHVDWPDGHQQTIEQVSANQRIQITRGDEG